MRLEGYNKLNLAPEKTGDPFMLLGLQIAEDFKNILGAPPTLGQHLFFLSEIWEGRMDLSTLRVWLYTQPDAKPYFWPDGLLMGRN